MVELFRVYPIAIFNAFFFALFFLLLLIFFKTNDDAVIKKNIKKAIDRFPKEKKMNAVLNLLSGNRVTITRDLFHQYGIRIEDDKTGTTNTPGNGILCSSIDNSESEVYLKDESIYYFKDNLKGWSQYKLDSNYSFNLTRELVERMESNDQDFLVRVSKNEGSDPGMFFCSLPNNTIISNEINHFGLLERDPGQDDFTRKYPIKDSSDYYYANERQEYFLIKHYYEAVITHNASFNSKLIIDRYAFKYDRTNNDYPKSFVFDTTLILSPHSTEKIQDFEFNDDNCWILTNLPGKKEMDIYFADLIAASYNTAEYKKDSGKLGMFMGSIKVDGAVETGKIVQFSGKDIYVYVKYIEEKSHSVKSIIYRIDSDRFGRLRQQFTQVYNAVNSNKKSNTIIHRAYSRKNHIIYFLEDSAQDYRGVKITEDRKIDTIKLKIPQSEQNTNYFFVDSIYELARSPNSYALYSINKNGDRVLDSAFNMFLGGHSIFKNAEIILPHRSSDVECIIKFNHNFALAHLFRTVAGKYDYEFIDKLNWPNDDSLVVNLDFDKNSLVLLVLFIIALYSVLFIILRSNFGKNKIDPFERAVFERIPVLREKLKGIDNQVSNLRVRSDIMLILGIIFGIGGVTISYLGFNLNNFTSHTWNPKTILGVVKPVVLLVFIETFTFFFLKQYRIIFNEYKLFYSIYLRVINYFALIDITESDELKNKADLSTQLTALVLAEKFDMYQNDIESPIKEFDDSSWLKVIEGLVGIKNKAP